MTLACWVNKRWFKRRWVFEAPVHSIPFEDHTLPQDVTITSMSVDQHIKDTSSSEGGIKLAIRLRGEQRIFNRLASGVWHFYAASHVPSQQTIGFSWLIIPDEKPIWYDSLWIPPGEARMADIYVEPQWRSKGIGRGFRVPQMIDIRSNKTVNIVSAVVEARNEPSLRIHRIAFSVKYPNYLIKIWGKNVLSITRKGNAISVSHCSRKRMY